MNKISVKKMSASWVTLRREFDRNEKAAEDIDILKNHFSSPFFSTRMFCKKKKREKKEKTRSFVEKYLNRLEDYGHCANSQITPGLPVENR